MKKFLTIFFVVLGVIFFLQLILITYLFVVDPWNIKPYLFPEPVETSVQVKTEATTSVDAIGSTDTKAPTPVSPTQAKALEAAGINPASVPQSFTPEQQACFEEVLGVSRVNEIKAGATPSLTEFYSARNCLD